MYLVLLIALCLFALMFGCADSNNDPLGEEASSYKKCYVETPKQRENLHTFHEAMLYVPSPLHKIYLNSQLLNSV